MSEIASISIESMARPAGGQSALSTPIPSSARLAATPSALKVMIVMPLAEQRGGAELALLHLIEHGRNLGVSWLVTFLADGPMVDLVRSYGVPTVIVSAGRLRQPHRMAAALLKLSRIARDESVNLVLSWLGKGQLYGGVSAVLAQKPAIWFQHGLPESPCWQDRLASALPSRRVFACSKASARAQEQVWPHRPVQVIHPGADLARFDPALLPAPMECRRILGLPPRGSLIGIVGRLQRWKGMHYVLEALPQVLKAHPDAHLVIVGGDHALEPDYPVILRDRIRGLGLTDRVILAGHQHNVPHWMQAMDVIVHASDNEPFGMVIVEAMALGKPVVATDAAGPREIINHEINGLLWQCGDVPSLTSGIIRLLNDPAAANALGTAARARSSVFSARNFAANVVEQLVGDC
jgi:glycosyltransferase involved in cell wall biosynthesis